MPNPHSERQLIFALIGLRAQLLPHDQLLEVFLDWQETDNASLGDLLVQRSVISDSDKAFIDRAVESHLASHDQDPAKSLASLRTAEPTAFEKEVANVVPRADDDPRRDKVSKVGRLSLPHRANRTQRQRFKVVRTLDVTEFWETAIAEDVELRREVLLKQVAEPQMRNLEACHRLMREAEVLSVLEHPSILPVYGFGQQEDGRPFFATRYVRGSTLGEAIRRLHGKPDFSGARSMRKRPTLERIAHLRELVQRLIDVANAAAFAHTRGIVHRNVNPESILIANYGETILVEWGLAKLMYESPVRQKAGEEGDQRGEAVAGSITSPGQTVGQLEYLSPEQARGNQVLTGPASDVFSLGAVLYAILVGRPPYDPEDADVYIHAKTGAFPAPRELNPHLDPALEAICLRAMAEKPHERYATPRVMVEELERWLDDQPILAAPESRFNKTRRWLKRKGDLIAGLCAVFLASTLIFGGGMTYLASSLENERNARVADLLALESAHRPNSSNDLPAPAVVQTPRPQPPQPEPKIEPKVDPKPDPIVVTPPPKKDTVVAKSDPKPDPSTLPMPEVKTPPTLPVDPKPDPIVVTPPKKDPSLAELAEAAKANPNDAEAQRSWARGLERAADADPNKRVEHLADAWNAWERALAIYPKDAGALDAAVGVIARWQSAGGPSKDPALGKVAVRSLADLRERLAVALPNPANAESAGRAHLDWATAQRSESKFAEANESAGAALRQFQAALAAEPKSAAKQANVARAALLRSQTYTALERHDLAWQAARDAYAAAPTGNAEWATLRLEAADAAAHEAWAASAAREALRYGKVAADLWIERFRTSPNPATRSKGLDALQLVREAARSEDRRSDLKSALDKAVALAELQPIAPTETAALKPVRGQLYFERGSWNAQEKSTSRALVDLNRAVELGEARTAAGARFLRGTLFAESGNLAGVRKDAEALSKESDRDAQFVASQLYAKLAGFKRNPTGDADAREAVRLLEGLSRTGYLTGARRTAVMNAAEFAPLRMRAEFKAFAEEGSVRPASGGGNPRPDA